LGAYLGREQQLATPYYGVGNTTTYDAANEAAPNPFYYRYGRVGIRFSADVQRPIAGPLRLLVGAGTRSAQIDLTPFDSGTTLLQTQQGGTRFPNARTTYGRAGLVYDTRDQETGPTRGQWIEVLAQRADKFAGGDVAFTRVTSTARGYWSLNDRLVLAERVTGQNLWGQVPFYELSTIQGSFSDGEGLGGSGSLRGWPKNRFIGKGVLFTNNELRWRVSDFSLRHRSSALVLNGFVDAGRVWAGGMTANGLFSDLHAGYGGGARLRYGQDFVVGADIGHSRESGAAIYIGLGYPF
jgi:outer membrane protein assembly factor BamA